MASYTITVEPLHINMTGVAFMTPANRYRDAAVICLANAIKTNGFDPIPYHLLCQSLELHLKSFIWLTDRIDSNTIKNKYGHNIEKLWNDSKVKGIGSYVSITPLRNSIISLIGPYYKKRQLTYLDLDIIFSGSHKLRNEPRILTTLTRLTSQLSKKLRTPILSAS